MNELFLFAGLPGVGKSTLSRAVSRRTGARIVDIDDFKKTDVDPTLVKSQIDPPEQRWSYYQKAARHVFGLFDQGVSIAILDEVFHLHTLRVQMEALCREHNVRVLWVEVRCPYDVVRDRLQSTAREGHILSTGEALGMHLLFGKIFEEFPAQSQNHIVIDNEGVDGVDVMAEIISRKWAIEGAVS